MRPDTVRLTLLHKQQHQIISILGYALKDFLYTFFMKHTLLTLFIIGYTLVPAISHGQVYINEIMYDLSGSDTGREWVEVYNGGGVGVDIAGWKFLESVSASNHALTQIQGVSLIPAGGFAVISVDPTKFLLDVPGFSGNLFKASFSSLNNTGSTVVLKDGSGTVVDQAVYTSDQGANGDGNSLQKNSASWISATPTPGATNATQSTATSTDDGGGGDTTPDPDSSSGGGSTSGGGSSAHSSPAPLSTLTEKMEFEVSAGRNRLATVGDKIVFRASVTKIQNMSERGIGYVWSFGDGTTGMGDTTLHAYKFGGEYVVVLNASYADKQAVDRISVKVVSPEIALSRVEGGVEVWNKSGSEINLEDWELEDSPREFVFPKDTLIEKNKKIVFADTVTRLNTTTLRLLNPMGEEFAVLSSHASSTKDSVSSTVSTSSIDVVAITSKIKSLKQELATMSPPADISSAPLIVVSSPTTEAETEENGVAISDQVAKDISTSTLTANTIDVFTAPQTKGIVGRVFAWPISGFNFIRHLFVEE